MRRRLEDASLPHHPAWRAFNLAAAGAHLPVAAKGETAAGRRGPPVG